MELIPAASPTPATTATTFHREITFSFAGFGNSFLRTFLLAFRAIRNVFPARAKDVILVFFLQTLVVFKIKLA
ncbi:MAG: hypothetical protein ACK4VN_09110 [Bacteroidales bacterium]